MTEPTVADVEARNQSVIDRLSVVVGDLKEMREELESLRLATKRAVYHRPAGGVLQAIAFLERAMVEMSRDIVR